MVGTPCQEGSAPRAASITQTPTHLAYKLLPICNEHLHSTATHGEHAEFLVVRDGRLAQEVRMRSSKIVILQHEFVKPAISRQAARRLKH